MLLEDARKILTLRFVQQWPTVSGGIPYSLDNRVTDEANPSYARFSVQFQPSRPWTIGAKAKTQRNGIVNIKINYKTNQGTLSVDQLWTQAAKLFERQRASSWGLGTTTLDDICCLQADPTDLGSDGQYYTMLCAVAFWFTFTGP